MKTAQTSALEKNKIKLAKKTVSVSGAKVEKYMIMIPKNTFDCIIGHTEFEDDLSLRVCGKGHKVFPGMKKIGGGYELLLDEGFCGRWGVLDVDYRNESLEKIIGKMNEYIIEDMIGETTLLN